MTYLLVAGEVIVIDVLFLIGFLLIVRRVVRQQFGPLLAKPVAKTDTLARNVSAVQR